MDYDDKLLRLIFDLKHLPDDYQCLGLKTLSAC